jgi:hypothetical protein
MAKAKNLKEAGQQLDNDVNQLGNDLTNATHLLVSSIGDSFCRAGRRFTHAITQIAIDDLTADQLAQLRGEPRLKVQAVTLDADADATEQ